jgi:hypothetical protein
VRPAIWRDPLGQIGRDRHCYHPVFDGRANSNAKPFLENLPNVSLARVCEELEKFSKYGFGEKFQFDSRPPGNRYFDIGGNTACETYFTKRNF